MTDDERAVLAVNQAYCDAFEAKDMAAMSRIWEHTDRVSCTHPGWPTLRGWAEVAASYFALFQGEGTLQFVLTRPRVAVQDDLAWVTVDENLLGNQGGATVASLNLYARAATTPGETPSDSPWRMVNHHGSVVHPPLPAWAGNADREDSAGDDAAGPDSP